MAEPSHRDDGGHGERQNAECGSPTQDRQRRLVELCQVVLGIGGSSAQEEEIAGDHHSAGNSGAKAAARKREWACSTPALTTAIPYSQICGTNMINSAATVTALPSHDGLANAVP